MSGVAYLAGSAADGGGNAVDIATPLSFAATLSGGSNLCLIVGAWVMHSIDVVTASFAFDGVAMTEAISLNLGTTRLYLMGLVAPHTGTKNVVITPSLDGSHIAAGAACYTGVHQATPFGDTEGAAGSSATPNLLGLTPTSVGDMCVATAASEHTFVSADAGQTIRWNRNSGSTEFCAGSDTPGTGGSVPMGFTLSSSFNWGMIGVNLLAAAAARRFMEVY